MIRMSSTEYSKVEPESQGHSEVLGDVELGQTTALPKKSALQPTNRSSNDVSWSNVTFRAGEKTILNNCWGHVATGEICAIMGPSGAGKSSLLNVLAGRSSTRGLVIVEGVVKIGDTQINPVAFRKNIAYVMQDDALMATATPREALQFSAKLRLPIDMGSSPDMINTLVEKTLEDLGLLECAEVMIGNAMIKGISGGQRKRTSVGVEIINSPEILFLDEPTSGLDSFNAYNLIKLLKEIARSNSAILCTVHQPSSEIFFLFDQVIFLKDGHMFYSGPVKEMVGHFNGLGHPCPEYYNPSDFVMNLCQILSPDELQVCYQGLPCPDTLNVNSSRKQHTTELDFVAARSVSEQVYYLVDREIKNSYRDTGSLIGRFGVTIFLSLVYGLIFLDVGGKSNADSVDFNAHTGGLTMVMVSSMFGSAEPVMLQFPFERPMFLREYSTGTYGTGTYFVSKMAVEAILTFLQMLLQLIIVYFLMDLQGSFIFLVLSAYGLAMASNSLALIIGCMVPDVKSVAELSPVVFVPQILFAGFFIRMSQVPVFMRWAQYLCGMKYGMNLALLTEFSLDNDSCKDGAARENCRDLLNANDIDANQFWLSILLLTILVVGFRILAALLLKEKAKTFY